MANNNASDIIDIKGLLAQYLSKWYLFVISVAVCGILALLFTKVKKPVYGVRANVLIQVDDINPLSAMGAVGDLLGSKGRVDDELYVISSHSLYRDVVKKLGINQLHYVRKGFLNTNLTYPDIPLEVTTPPGVADTLSVGVIFKVKVGEDGLADIKAKAKRKTIAEVKDAKLPVTLNTVYGDFTIDKTQFFPTGQELTDKISFTGYHAAAEDISEDIATDIASKKSNAIELAINTKNADYGMAILNEIIALYNQRGIHEKNIQGEKTAQFINDRLEILNEGLTDSEIAIQQYKQNNRITDVEAEALYQTTKKGELETALVTAETQSEIIKMTREFLGNPGNAYSLVPAALDDQGLQAAIEAYNKVVLQRLELLKSAKDNNLGLRQLNEQLDMMRGNILESVSNAYNTSLVVLRELRAKKSEADASLGRVPLQEREYITLKRQQAVKQNLYTFLLQRNEETAMLLANAVPKGIIVDEAYTLSKPLGIGRFTILLIALMCGMCIPPAWLYAKKLLRNRFETREEAEKILDAPVLGEMCINKTGESVVVSPKSTSSVTELFRLMRTNLLFMLNDSNDKVVLMTSARSGEGKSFISINLAASLALLEHKRVLLVGMDIRSPQLANYLGIAPDPGLTQYLASSGYTLDQVIRRSTFLDDLDIIVAGPVPPNPAELLASEKVDNMFRELRERYDYIIIDSAPVGMVSDSFSLDRVADATVFVTRVNHTTNTDLRFANEIYADNRLKKLSVVINGTKSKQGYGYGYQQ